MREQGQPAEAVASYERALHLRPDFAGAHWNRAIIRPLMGDFARGWPEYQGRWRCQGFALPIAGLGPEHPR